MENTSHKPDPRWTNFIQQFDSNGKVVGFKLEGSNFLYEYDQHKGWTDEHGKLYDSNGVLVDSGLDESSDQSGNEIDDDQIVDQFQKMLIEQEEGVIKSKSEKKTKAPSTDIDFLEQTKSLIQKLNKGIQLREGIKSDVWIFFKMKSNLYEKVNPQVEKEQSIQQKNKLIREKKKLQEQKKKALLESNKWLSGEFFLDFSGVSLQKNSYDRYWYGWVKATPQTYFAVIEEINSSKEFSVLKSKSFYALKSKFFLKSKMKQTIKQLKDSIQNISEDNAVLIKINNLPEQFPLSFVLDLVQISGGYLEDIEDIDIIDDFSADMICRKRTAELFTNIEGYPHDAKQYVWLEIEDEKRLFRANSFFNVEVDAEYKPLWAQLSDVLTLESSKDEIAKFYDDKEEFRLAVNQKIIKKILMFRGESLNIVRIVRFIAKEQ